MAKRTYLKLVNTVLKRVKQSTVATVVGLTAGTHADIISELFNDAQNEIYTLIGGKWYTLLTQRTISTVASTATYAVASDFGSSLVLKDTTNNHILTEDFIKDLDRRDPDEDLTGIPNLFSLQGANYRLYPIPAAVYSLTDRYWKEPTALAADADTSELPLFCENAMIKWVESQIWSYLNNSVKSQLFLAQYVAMKDDAIEANTDILDRVLTVASDDERVGGTQVSSRTRLQFPVS